MNDTAYWLGFYVGMFITGAAIGGIIPMIIFFVKKSWLMGIISPIICGMLSFINPLVSIICGVILMIAAIILKKNDPYKDDIQEEMENIRKEKEDV